MHLQKRASCTLSAEVSKPRVCLDGKVVGCLFCNYFCWLTRTSTNRTTGTCGPFWRVGKPLREGSKPVCCDFALLSMGRHRSDWSETLAEPSVIGFRRPQQENTWACLNMRKPQMDASCLLPRTAWVSKCKPPKSEADRWPSLAAALSLVRAERNVFASCTPRRVLLRLVFRVCFEGEAFGNSASINLGSAM